MKVYVFGNTDAPEDGRAVEVAQRLEGTMNDVSFVFVGPNEEVPFADEGRVVILDTVSGIRDVVLIPDGELDGFVLSPRATLHDFDLAFQLKYLRKIGRLGEVADHEPVVGQPAERPRLLRNLYPL